MSVDQTKANVNEGSHSAIPAWPAVALALVLLGLGALISPHFIEKLVALHRWRHDERLVAYSCQAVLGILALATLFKRKSVNSRFHKIFPTSREFSIAVLTVALSLAFSLIVAEGAARLLHFPFSAKWVPSETPLARFDSELGWSYIPNQTVTQEFGTDHRKITMYFDDLGCRVKKPENTQAQNAHTDKDHPDRTAPTALLVGDSLTFGHGVTYEESFAGRLAARSDFPFHVVNLGVQAYGTDQTLLLLKRQFKKFNTRLVVYTFSENQIARNEVSDRRIQFPDVMFVGTKPMFALKPDGSLSLVKRPLEFKDVSYSHLWAAFLVFEARRGPPPSIDLTRAIIKEMKDFSEANGARFIVVDWDGEDDFPWGLDLDLIRVRGNPPAGLDDWIIPGETHPDPRAHRYVADLIATEVLRGVTGSKPVEKPVAKPDNQP
jgi:hypothetical protein